MASHQSTDNPRGDAPTPTPNNTERMFQMIDDLKVKGNAALSAGSFSAAISNYEKVNAFLLLKHLTRHQGIKFALKIRVDKEDHAALQKKLLILYINLSHAQNKASNFAGKRQIFRKDGVFIIIANLEFFQEKGEEKGMGDLFCVRDIF